MALTQVQTAMLGIGAVLQVVQGSTASSTNATTSPYVDTGLTVNITPKSASSKILVVAYCGMCTKTSADTQMNIQIVRASSSIFVSAALNTNAATTGSTNPTLVYLDSPATTSTTQYKIQMGNRDGAGTVIFNSNGTSTITLIEIAA